jgi:hypothetical protein
MGKGWFFNDVTKKIVEMFKGIENCRRFMRAKLANITPKTRVYCVSVNGDCRPTYNLGEHHLVEILK